MESYKCCCKMADTALHRQDYFLLHVFVIHSLTHSSPNERLL